MRRMFLILTISTLFLCSFQALGAIVNLRGKTVDQFGAPVAGASLTIKRALILGTTALDGGFVLSEVQTSVVSAKGNIRHAVLPRVLPNGIIAAFIPANVKEAHVSVFTVQGALLFSHRYTGLSIGEAHFNTGDVVNNCGSQLCIIRLTLDAEQYTFSLISLKGRYVQGHIGPAALLNSGSSDHSNVGNLRKMTAIAVDTLIIHKALYADDSIPIPAYTSDMGTIIVTKVVADTALCSRISADSLYKLGLKAYNATDYNTALAYFSQYLKRYTTMANGNDARFYYGESWYMETGYDSAIVQFNAFLAARPTSSMRAMAQLGIGDCYYYNASIDTPQYLQALTAFNTVLTSYATAAAECSHAQERVGECYYNFAKNYASAETNLLKVLSLYPSCQDAPNAEYYIGRCRMQASDYANAIVRFNTVLTKYPTSTKADNCAYWSGRCYYLQANYAAANTKFIACRTSYPGNSYVDKCYYYGGLCYARLGNCVSAKADLASMQSLYPASLSLAKARTYITAICP